MSRGKGNSKGPEFIRFLAPLIQSIKELGGSATRAEATEQTILKANIPEDDLKITNKNGGSRIENQVNWARFYLAKSGYLTSARRGIWELTEKGFHAVESGIDPQKIFKEVQETIESEKIDTDIKSQEISSKSDEADPEDTIERYTDHKESLLRLLGELPPDGFERICQYLLRASGFNEVNVTGRSGDGGIDGEGTLRINNFVSMKVLFQSKRYKGSVSSPQVRDFRGAMLGRAEKGIIITTGTFTRDAIAEARRDGAPPIELVDGDRLVELFESLQIGLKPKQSYEVDFSFFEKFK